MIIHLYYYIIHSYNYNACSLLHSDNYPYEQPNIYHTNGFLNLIVISCMFRS